MLVPYRLYQASDKAFNIGVGTDTLWQRFCQALDRPDLAADERFTRNADRVRNRDELEPILDDHFSQHEAGYWLERLRDARIPCGQVNSLPEILDDAHFRHRGGVVELDHPLVSGLKVLANPLHFSETPPRYDRHPPLLGEHTDDILASLGYNEESIAELRAAGAV
jgi:formyl-CoA transferase/CoA:oxalate CoA-transferase